MRRRLVAITLLAVAPMLVSCRKKVRPKPLPAKIPVEKVAKPAPAPLLDLPPEIAMAILEIGEWASLEPTVLPPPPAPRRRPTPSGPRVAAPEPVPVTPTPQLRPLLTADQRRELDRAVNERLRRARAVLGSANGRNLSGEQRDLANQIRTFIRQAEEARGTDLLRANNLAERAEVLAQDLAQRLR